MIKKLMVISGLVLTLAGCGKQATTKKSSASSSVSSSRPVATTLNYDKLTKKEQKKVGFEFKAVKASVNAATYSINMTVRNRTNKTVRFDPNDFSLNVPSDDSGNSKVASNVTGKLIVNRGKKATVKSLFINLDEQYFTSAGEFFYAQKRFPLAYSYQANIGSGVNSDNLHDANLISLNQKNQSTTTNSSSSQTAASSSSKASETSKKTAASASKSNSAQYTGKQLALIAHYAFFYSASANQSASEVAQNLQNDLEIALYGSGTSTSGASSAGTGPSYVKYAVSGDVMTLTHPATNAGNDGSTATVRISQIAPKIFTGANAALAQKVIAHMQDE
ncbi:hypothetical protein [Lacticaseibacillus songhuajiangensis]|uniref:hypothetical protein n=1 Tax=Lacticaseibacillus songhuajiangensis TaxID=1296539 RepID=UPI000F7A6C4A|nr:hypothetical protein [Lacticaseibacillus songhuajiangensis]